MEDILSSGFLPLKIADFLTAQDMLRTRCVCRQWSACFDLDHMVRRVARLGFQDLAILGSVPDRLPPHHSFSKLGDLDLASYTPAFGHASSSRTVSTRSSSSLRSLGTPAPLRAAGAMEPPLAAGTAPSAGSSEASSAADTLAGLPVPRVRRADRAALQAAASLTADGGAQSAGHGGAKPALAFAAAATAVRGSELPVAAGGSGHGSVHAGLHADDGLITAAAAATAASTGPALVAAIASPPSSPRASAAACGGGARAALSTCTAAAVDIATGGAGASAAGAAARPVTPPRSTAAAADAHSHTPLPLLPATPATPASWRSVADGSEPPLDPCSWVAHLSKDGGACARIRCLRVAALLPEAVLSSMLARCSRLERLDAARVDRVKDSVSQTLHAPRHQPAATRLLRMTPPLRYGLQQEPGLSAANAPPLHAAVAASASYQRQSPPLCTRTTANPLASRPCLSPPAGAVPPHLPAAARG